VDRLTPAEAVAVVVVTAAVVVAAVGTVAVVTAVKGPTPATAAWSITW
jgi:hypothetical protein